jgi:putative addiction module component (TIGR02574 family)
MGHPAIDIDTLSPEERLDLLEKLWDSLEPSQIPVTEAQKRELDRRLDALDRDVAERRALGVPWDEVLEQLRRR